MAVLLVYRLDEATPTSVTYLWGDDPERLTSRVTLDPTDPDRPPRGDGDRSSRDRVAGKVTLRWMREGEWPRGGAIQS